MTNIETPASAPHFAVAGSLLEALAVGDFGRVAAVFEDDATLSALLPGGFRQWHGPAAIAAAFERWFGDVEDRELIDASLGQVSARLQMRWQMRVRAVRFGSHSRVVEQYAYADTGATERLQNVALLCSGFCREHFDV
jgi:hypothetical protein